MNVLSVGDLHSPFDLDDYLKFNIGLYKKYRCNMVVFIGDVVDLHAISSHHHDPDGKSAGDELEAAIKRLKRYYKAFPEATITMGNHDNRIAKAAFKNGLSKHFLKDFGEVIQAPKTWKFVDEVTIDNVLYMHGSIGDAYKRCQKERMSVVSGHLHTKAGVQYFTSRKDTIFGMQVGCGVDDKAYAFAYAKDTPDRSVIASGVVIDGRLPIVEIL